MSISPDEMEFADPVETPLGATTIESVDGVSRGPAELGRSALIGSGQPHPEEWSDCDAIVVDTSGQLDPSIVDQLHIAWATRSPLVIELIGAIPVQEVISEAPIWSHDPGLDLLSDRLNFLLSANVVDLRNDGSSSVGVSAAVTLGARQGGTADIMLPNGTEVWVDAGPYGSLTKLEASATRIVHATAVEAGSLDPIGLDTPHADLAADQLAAVNHTAGPARVIAPAGSGKTTVLTARARAVLDGRGFPTASLTLVAFNKRAQLEMRERTTDLAALQVRTLNALGLAILRGRAPFARSRLIDRAPEVITEREVRSILDRMLNLRRRANADQLAPWLEALTAVRLGLRDPDEVESSFGGDVEGLAEVVARYRDHLRDRGLVDFDEQIVYAIEVLLADPSARRAAQRTCRMMLVDEFQDLTPAHLLLVRILAAPAFDVFAVGDDDQTIYGFTGARPDWLIDFARWFPQADQHALETNYRCPPAVVAAADSLLTHNLHRVDKVICADPDRHDGASALQIVPSPDPIRTATNRVQELLEVGTNPEDIVVLTRVNASLAPIQVALSMAEIPVDRAVDEVFLTRSGVAAVLAWIRLATGGAPFAARDLEAAARRPTRGLSPKLVGWLGEQRDIASIRRLANRLNRDNDTHKVDVFADDVQRLLEANGESAPTEELIEIIRDDLGLAGSLDTLDSSRRNVDRSSHGDDLAALHSLARLQPDPREFEPWLRSHLSVPGDPSGVPLSTIHRVKGREWPHVILLGADAGSFPHRLASDTEEERRVFHVGLTRGSESVTVIATTGHQSEMVSQLTTRRDPTAEVIETARRPSRIITSSTAQTPQADPIRDALKLWRRQRAKEESVPAYVVFNDKTLDDLVSRRPVTLQALSSCHGIGPAKLERFGDELLGVVEDAFS